jgi:spore coat protein U-like protein
MPALAKADCQFFSVGDASFGTYDVFSTTPNIAGVGNLRINCHGGGHASVVKLSTGQSNRYITRTMRSGRDELNYNLYTSAARDVIWGDGTGGSSVMSTPKNQDVNLDVFGSIPEGQDPAVGTYSDIIVISVEF